jgi:magnesium-transporting ATPase (P-type)
MNRGVTANHELAPSPAAPETAHPWHQMPVEAVLVALKSTLQGLDAHEAQRRLTAVGPNEITEGKRRTPLRMFGDQFTDFMILDGCRPPGRPGSIAPGTGVSARG